METLMKPRCNEFIDNRTKLQNEAREKLRKINADGLAGNRFTVHDLPAECIEVYIIDHRFKEAHHVVFRRTNKINSYTLQDMVKGAYMGKYGAGRGLTEIARRLIKNISNQE